MIDIEIIPGSLFTINNKLHKVITVPEGATCFDCSISEYLNDQTCPFNCNYNKMFVEVVTIVNTNVVCPTCFRKWETDSTKKIIQCIYCGITFER
jgi:hypothetical protein